MSFYSLYAPIIMAYLLGTISNAVWISRAFSLPDPRQHGSQNPGATNMVRLSGKRWGGVVLALDALKGALPVLIAMQLGYDAHSLALIWGAAVIGHVFPFWSLKQGGKGVATYLGGLLAVYSPAGGLFILAWFVIFKCTRVSALAALLSTVLVSVVSTTYWHQGPAMAWWGLSVLLWFRHLENLKRLFQKTELSFERSKDNEA